MSFVLKNPKTGMYSTGRYGNSADLQKARTYTRACDASNSRKYRSNSDDWTVVPVKLVEEPID